MEIMKEIKSGFNSSLYRTLQELKGCVFLPCIVMITSCTTVQRKDNISISEEPDKQIEQAESESPSLDDLRGLLLPKRR